MMEDSIYPLPCQPSGSRILGLGCVVETGANAGVSPRGPSFLQPRRTPGEGCGPKTSCLALPAGGRGRAALKRRGSCVGSFQVDLLSHQTCHRTSLVVQWLRIHLTMQGIPVRSLLQDSTCHWVTIREATAVSSLYTGTKEIVQQQRPSATKNN